VEPDTPLELDRLGKEELVDRLDDGYYVFPLTVLPPPDLLNCVGQVFV
jgi:hypothetical protein